MMTEENTQDSQSSHPELTPGAADKKGQMLVIYLPEGSVIVDRTDINLTSVPKVAEQIETKSEPVEEIEEAAPQQLQPTLQEVVQLAVQEVLQITGHAQKQPPKVETPAPIAESVKPIEERHATFADYPAPAPRQNPSAADKPSLLPTDSHVTHGVRRVHVRRRRKLNWVHGVNTLLVSYLLLVAIVPAVLSSAFGMAIYASKSAHPGALIAKGDLMVCTEIAASKLKVNDVLLVRDGNSWHLDARQVTSISTTGALSTVATASTGGTAIDKTYVLPKDNVSYKVSRVIPKLGYAPIVLSSTIAKALGGLFILILNLTVHYRRLRKRRLETVIR